MKTGILITMVLLFFTPISILSARDNTGDEEGELIRSMGIASRTEFSWGPMFVLDNTGDEYRYGGGIQASIFRNLMSPIMGLGITGEGYVQGVEDEEVDGGLRAMAGVKLIFLNAGVDYAFRDESLDLILSMAFPLRRGGLFRKGDNLRVDWIPGRDNSFNIGYSLPLGQPFKGKTRTTHTSVKLPKSSNRRNGAGEVIIPAELEKILERVDHAADWITRYTSPYFDQNKLDDEKKVTGFIQKVRSFKDHINLKDDLYPGGHTYEAEIDMYHRMLEQAFRLAADGDHQSARDRDVGLHIVDKAREIIFHDIIIPYNQLLGRSKKHDSLNGYSATAMWRFKTWLEFSSQTSDSQRNVVLAVFSRLLQILEKHREGSKSVWKESELVWIPLQYGLQPDQYDTREELNRILEQMTDRCFSNANDAYYVINEQFQPEVARMIFNAEDYHVLWIHDYRGVNYIGNPDSVSFHQTTNVYLKALTQRVREYDKTGKLPAYLILLDQFFFEPSGHFWIELLQDPLHYKLKLPKEYREWVDQVEAAQDELRNAISESTKLQSQTEKYGKNWLRKKIKVHVNITNPADYSFRNSELIAHLPIAPDELMRDHRKISFYDVTELDPGKGEALYSGMGIGEQYVGRTWEDRALLVRGPVLVGLKDEARRMLLQQGFKTNEIPPPLRKQPKPLDYDRKVEALRLQGWDLEAMDVHNQTGFRPKSLNVLKASMYNCMPRGSILMIPDGYWNTPFWSGMLIGAAFRGCNVLFIAPAQENSTFSDAYPLISRAHELFTRLVIIQNDLRDELETVGGSVKTGIYARDTNLGEITTVEEMLAGINNNSFLCELFPFSPEVYSTIEEVVEELKSAGLKPSYFADDAIERKPKLHLKVNVCVSGSIIDLLSQPGWADIIRAYLHYRARFIAREDIFIDVKDVPENLRTSVDQTLSEFWERLPDEDRERTMAYLILGSQNHNYRSMIMDGEVASVISGDVSLQALIDLIFLSGITVWIEDQDTLEKYVPSQKGLARWLGRFMMKAM